MVWEIDNEVYTPTFKHVLLIWLFFLSVSNCRFRLLLVCNDRVIMVGSGYMIFPNETLVVIFEHKSSKLFLNVVIKIFAKLFMSRKFGFYTIHAHSVFRS